MDHSLMCNLCFGKIVDRFYLSINGKSYHEECMHCAVCHSYLNETCYFKNDEFLCREDYERKYRSKCGVCNLFVFPNETFIKVQQELIHIACLYCGICGRSLQKGEEFIKSDGQVICQAHFGTFKTQQPLQKSTIDNFQEVHRTKDGRRGPKRPRTILTAMQRRQFKASFEISPKPCRKTREALAKETGLSVRVVQVWFQNQRAKMKKIQRRAKSEQKEEDKQEDNQDEELSDDIESEDDEASESDPSPSTYSTNPIDKLYMMQDLYF